MLLLCICQQKHSFHIHSKSNIHPSTSSQLHGNTNHTDSYSQTGLQHCNHLYPSILILPPWLLTRPLPHNCHSFMLGDLNSHHPAWYSADQPDTRGLSHIQQFNNLNNSDLPTRKPYNIHISPDSSTTPSLAMRSTWRPLLAPSSDHLPLQISFSVHRTITNSPNTTFSNYKHADWNSFTASIENTLQNFDLQNYTSIDAAIQHFNDTIINANKHFIPSGNERHANPTFNLTTKLLIRTRNHLRSSLPTLNTLARIRQLNTEIDTAINIEQKARCGNMH